MRKTLPVILSLLALVAIIFPFVFTLGFAVLTPPMYQDTFVGVLDEKFERLNSVEGEKIVVVGGSSVAFGLDSELLEKYTGMPVVSFGLYAALGTKMMLDLSLSGIGRGDVVILSPEMDRQTLSLYFNADTAWRAIEGNPKMLAHVGFDNISQMIAGAFSYAGSKLSIRPVAENGGSVYLAKYFNEYGDFKGYPRHENIMAAYYDVNTPIELNKSAYGEELESFADYVNSYIRKCKMRGATVYFSYAPMNALAISGGSGIEERLKFSAYLEELIDCEFITELDRAVFDAGYFFDTNFHLNDAGMEARTLRLAKDIKLALGIAGGVVDKEPEAPSLPKIEIDYDGFDENAKYFTYEKLPTGALIITGLTEEGMEASSLTIPRGHEGKRVLAVKGGAFSGAKMNSLTVTADAYLVIFQNGAFAGASNLTDLWMYKPSGDAVAPPLDFYGTKEGFRVHVPEGSDYAYHYYWSERRLTFVFDAN